MQRPTYMWTEKFYSAARFLRWTAGLAALLVLAACGGADAETDTPSAEANVLTLGARDVAGAERGTLSTGIALTGTLRPYRVVNVRAQVAGVVSEVRVDAGDPVRRGERMAAIAAEGIRSQVAQARSAVASAEAQVALARKQVESARVLYEAGAMSEIEYENAQAAFEAAQAQLAAAEAQLATATERAGRTVINAPITGVVSERSVEEGEAVSPGAPLFTVVNTDYLELAAQVPVSRAARLDVGQPVLFTISAYPGRTFRGEIDRIDPTADPQTRQLGVYLRLPNQERDLVGGLFATGRVVLEELSDALIVPESAVRTREGNTYAYVIGDGQVARRPIQVQGRNTARGLVAVASGLSEGARVLTAPEAEMITAGTRVRISDDVTTANGASMDSTATE